MNSIQRFANSMAFETSINDDAAEAVVKWLIAEGVLDFGVLTETYPEQQPSVEGVVTVANDA